MSLALEKSHLYYRGLQEDKVVDSSPEALSLPWLWSILSSLGCISTASY